MQVTEPEAAKARLNFDREQTLGQIADLEREFAAIVASAADGSAGSDDENDPEGATVAFERQHVAALLDRACAHLEAIDAASRKLESGSYEICDICGRPIGAERWRPPRPPFPASAAPPSACASRHLRFPRHGALRGPAGRRDLGPVSHATDRIVDLSPTPSTAPIGVAGVGDRW